MDYYALVFIVFSYKLKTATSTRTLRTTRTIPFDDKF